MKHLPLKEMAWAVAFVIVALLLYGGSYVMLVSEETEELVFTGVGTIRFRVVEGSRYKPSYPFGADVAVRFFSLAY
jgi:hypothetical protein